MASYKYSNYLAANNSDEFDKVYTPPNVNAPHAGIYRCDGCGREIGIAQGHELPPQNHHQHTTAQGKVRWKLIVYADHTAK